jgi:peptidoglycan hydrolase-like protein with peptidoglycan-binding domain
MYTGRSSMKRLLFTLLLSALVGMVTAQTATNTTAPSERKQTGSAKADKPRGTVATEKHVETVVQPRAKEIRVTRDVIRASQTKLGALGYDAGPADGRMTARTRAAIREFQSAKNLRITGRLDQPTLAKLNVGGSNMITSAPTEMGRAAVAAGHNVKEGHPIAAGKAIGKGAGRFGKKVGQGTKAVVVGTKDKLLGTKPKEPK